MGEATPESNGAHDVAELYRRHGRALWALLYAHCCDRELALDAVHEAFVRLQTTPGARVRDAWAWLKQVGRNWLCDHARRRSQVKWSVLSPDVVAADHDPSASAMRRELHEQVRNALGELREEDREVLVLRYALEWDSQRMADVLGTTATAVDMRLSRARRRLAAILDPTGAKA